MIRQTVSSLVVVVVALLLAGAHGCVKPPIEGRQDPYTPSQVMFASKDLKNNTAVMAPAVSRDEAGILHVTLPIRAATNLQLYIDYRTTFFDRNGQEVSRTNWMSKTLAPNVPDRIVVSSMGPNAADLTCRTSGTRNTPLSGRPALCLLSGDFERPLRALISAF